MSLRISGCKTLKHQYIFIWRGIDVKNRMKKRCMASILALVMMCLLGACGTDKAETKLYPKKKVRRPIVHQLRMIHQKTSLWMTAKQGI